MAKKKSGLSRSKVKKALKGTKKDTSGLWNKIEKKIKKADRDSKGKK